MYNLTVLTFTFSSVNSIKQSSFEFPKVLSVSVCDEQNGLTSLWDSYPDNVVDSVSFS